MYVYQQFLVEIFLCTLCDLLLTVFKFILVIFVSLILYGFLTCHWNLYMQAISTIKFWTLPQNSGNKSQLYILVFEILNWNFYYWFPFWSKTHKRTEQKIFWWNFDHIDLWVNKKIRLRMGYALIVTKQDGGNCLPRPAWRQKANR